jgi:O-antigen/teichoic acid export membrane protein
MTLAKKVALNTIVQTASKIISTALGLLTIALMTRYLGPSGFGEYTTIITFISFFAVIADLGLTLVTVQLISVPDSVPGDTANDQNRILSNLFSLRLLSALFFLGLAPIIIWLLPYDQAIKIGVLIATASFLFPALNQILVGLFQKKLRLDRVSIAEIASRLLLFAAAFAVAHFGYGLDGMLYALVLSSALNFGLLWLFSKKYAKISLNFDKNLWLTIIKKTWPIGLTIFLNLIYLRADTLILSLLRDSNEVGIYGASYRVIDVLITLPFIFAGIVLPILTAGWQSNRDNFNSVLQKSFDLMVLLALPLIVGTQFVGKRIMTIVGGSEFAISGDILRVLILGAGIIFVGTVFSHAIIAIDHQKKIISAYAFVAATALIGYLVFIPRYGYYGAAWVTIYSELAIALAAYILVKKVTGFSPGLSVAGKAFVSSLVMAAALSLLSGLNLVFLVIFAIMVYFICLYFLKGITNQQILELISKG